MKEVVEIKTLDNFRIWIRFKDGVEKVIDFRKFLRKRITEELLDGENFKRIGIEPSGGISWYNGFDFCPNYLKEL